MIHMEIIVILLVLSSVFTVSITSGANDDLIVQLEKGKIRGHVLKSGKGNDYYGFQEIPYAAPPVGKNRFQLPKEPEAWDDVLNTTKNTKICYQATSKYDDVELSEDCLYINVYTPEKPGTEKTLRPVLFWIHGGGFTFDSATYQYSNPKYVIDHDIVVVLFTYRLGPFGFVGTDDGVIPVNLGLKDQRFAIEWVNRNIHLFGGNPEQVVIVGESAGSIAVGLHLLGPWTNDKQLFHGAIMQSGSPVSSLYQGNATKTAFDLGKAVDPSFTSTDTKELLQVLQSATASDILNASISSGVVEEPEGPFSYRGFPSYLNGVYKKVPVIIGFNSEEMIFAGAVRNDTQLEQIDAHPEVLVNSKLNMSPENRVIAGNLLKQVYTHNTTFINEFGGYVRYTSDSWPNTGTCKQVELGSSVVPYYFYQFSYKGELGGMMEIPNIPGTERVSHAEDLHYIWANEVNQDVTKFPEKDQLTLQRITKLWANFVKYLNPTPDDNDPLFNVKWLTSEADTLRYLNINETLEMREHPRQYQQVKEILETYMEPPFDVFS